MGEQQAVRTSSQYPDDLPRLLAEVRRTRTAQQVTQRLLGTNAERMLPAQRASLRALEAYAAALDRRGWPLPPKMRFELHLLRSMCGTASRR